MAVTADVVAMSLIEPLHELSFALLHLACMRLLGEMVPPGFGRDGAGDLRNSRDRAVTSLLTLTVRDALRALGAGGFGDAVLCLCAMPFIAQMAKAEQG